MNARMLHNITLGALLTLAAAAPAAAQMDHSSMGHGSHAAAPAPAAAPPAPASSDFRKVVVNGYTLRYELIDLKQAMASSPVPMAHDMSKMKSHHLMVYPVGTGGGPLAAGKAGYLIVQPDKSEVKAMAMLMGDGFGADVDFVAKGDYKITTKIVLGATTLVDEFVHTVK